MRKLLSIFLLLLLCSCSSISLEEDRVVKRHFSNTEIASLDSILTFFDNEVIRQTPHSAVIPSYKKLFQILRDSIEADHPTIALDINRKKLEELFLDLPDSLSKNWYTDYSYTYRTGDSTLFRDIHPFGSYGDFLKSASKKNDFIAEYYDEFKHSQAISPSMTANMLMFPEKLNIRKERERLIYAIHFITLQKPTAH